MGMFDSIDWGDPGTMALLGMAAGAGNAAMPSRMPVPTGAVFGSLAGGAAAGAREGLQNRASNQSYASGDVDLQEKVMWTNLMRRYLGLSPLTGAGAAAAAKNAPPVAPSPLAPPPSMPPPNTNGMSIGGAMPLAGAAAAPPQAPTPPPQGGNFGGGAPSAMPGGAPGGDSMGGILPLILQSKMGVTPTDWQRAHMVAGQYDPNTPAGQEAGAAAAKAAGLTPILSSRAGEAQSEYNPQTGKWELISRNPTLPAGYGYNEKTQQTYMLPGFLQSQNTQQQMEGANKARFDIHEGSDAAGNPLNKTALQIAQENGTAPAGGFGNGRGYLGPQVPMPQSPAPGQPFPAARPPMPPFAPPPQPQPGMAPPPRPPMMPPQPQPGMAPPASGAVPPPAGGAPPMMPPHQPVPPFQPGAVPMPQPKPPVPPMMAAPPPPPTQAGAIHAPAMSAGASAGLPQTPVTASRELFPDMSNPAQAFNKFLGPNYQFPGRPAGQSYGKPSEFQTEQAQEASKMKTEFQSDSSGNQQVYTNMQQLYSLLDGIRTGKMTPALSTLTGLAKQMGIDTTDSKYDPANADAFNKLATDMVFKNVEEMRGQPRVAAIQGMRESNASLTMQPEANVAILNSALSKMRWEDARSQMFSQYAGHFGQPGDFVDKWNQQYPEIDTFADITNIAKGQGWKMPSGENGTGPGAANASQPAAYTQRDLTNTAFKYGVTVDEAKQILAMPPAERAARINQLRNGGDGGAGSVQ